MNDMASSNTLGRVRAACAGLATLVLVIVVGSPLIALVLPGPWKRHVYHEISFQLIARNVLSDAKTDDDRIRMAVDYTRRHLWLFGDSQPYDGRAFDYLVEGVGWCDYHAKVLCQLLAAVGIHARYDFLIDRNGVSPHTVAEVRVRGEWRAIDPFFDLSYLDAGGDWANLEEVTPALIAQLPDVGLIKQVNDPLYQNISDVAQRAFPLQRAPQRSDDFLAEKHIFDFVAAGYVRLFGARFANWYQDVYLSQSLPQIRGSCPRMTLGRVKRPDRNLTSPFPASAGPGRAAPAGRTACRTA